jgi:fructose-bisphosphate aldolase class II
VLVTLSEVLARAEDREAAVGAFNFSNLEVLQAIVEAAEAVGAPAILAVSEGAIRYAGFEALRDLARGMAERSPLPFALHLDHGRDRAIVSRCIQEGFTSVMFDGSHLPIEENIRQTREVVEEAHARGVSVEGEIGRLQGIEEAIRVEEGEDVLTDPAEAARFAEETGVDALAVAVGTSHGPYKFKGTPRLDFDRLEAIRRRVAAPLVLHGVSGVDRRAVERARAAGIALEGAQGVPDEAIRGAIARGVRKINIDTDMRLAFTTALREQLARSPEVFDPRKVLGAARDAVRRVVEGKMRLFWVERG